MEYSHTPNEMNITSEVGISYSLEPYAPGADHTWSSEQILHVYRRLGFGASKKILSKHITSSREFISDLIREAKEQEHTPAPFWAYFALRDYDDFKTDNVEFIREWRNQAGADLINKSLKGRLMLFWMNHFVVRHEVHGFAPYLYQYYNIIERNALGNFKNFVREVGTSNAMLQFLNGFENRKEAPNENYARELFELFTLGEDNGYTQFDIVEAARALTGYNHQDGYGNTIYYNESTHDPSAKTIFGQEGNWGYQDLIEILFQERGDIIAKFIVEKVYRNFVNPHISDQVQKKIIIPLAQKFVQNDFAITPLMKTLFSSKHFFDPANVGVVIKSPLDLIIQLTKESDLGHNKWLVRSMMGWTFHLGQRIFNPPNVAGWPGDKTWINTATLMGRWEMTRKFLTVIFERNTKVKFVEMARNLSDDSDNPEYVARAIMDHFMPRKLNDRSHYDTGIQIFTQELDGAFKWDHVHPRAANPVYHLMLHLITLPEFQLR